MQQFADLYPLRNRRAHEVTGPAAASFAFGMAGQLKGPVIWIMPEAKPEKINPIGATRFIDPARLIVCYGASQLDLLWMAEEALRSGAVPLVVTQLGADIDLTAGRRLQLAAEAGRAMGLFLLPEGAGSNAAETRWHCAPVNAQDSFSDSLDSTLFEWRCIKNKSGTNGNWVVRWNGAAHRIDLLSHTGERPDIAAQAG